MEVKPESLLAHADFVRGLARQLLSDENQVDDAVQETWLKALKRPPQATGSVRSWLASVIRNIIRSSRRDESRRIQREKAAVQRETEEATEKLLERESVRRLVVQAVLELAGPYRVAIILRFYDNLPPREIAKRLEVPVETAKTHLKRGLSQLRQKLDAQHGGDRMKWLMAVAPIAGIKMTSSAGAATGTGAAFAGVAAMGTKVKVSLFILILIGGVMTISFLMNNDYSVTHSEQKSMSPVHPAADRFISQGDKPIEIVSSSETNLAENISPHDARQKLASGGIAVEGRVVNIEGKPIEGVFIDETVVEGYRTIGTLSIVNSWKNTGLLTNQAGFFGIVVPANRIPLTYLRFSHQEYGYRTASLMNAVLGNNNTYHLDDMRMTPAYFINGRVINKSGIPIAGCRVSAPGMPWDKRKTAESTSVITDEEGRFQLKKMWEDQIQVTAYHEDFGIGFSNPVKPGRNKEIPELSIILRKGRTISGCLMNADGTSAAGKSIFAIYKTAGGRIRLDTVTDDEGKFNFDPLPMGAYQIRTEIVGYRNISGDPDSTSYLLVDGVIPGRSNLLLYLPLNSNLIIHLKDRNGSPIDIEPRVLFKPVNLNKSSVILDSWWGKADKKFNGTLEYRDIQPGIYQINIMHLDYMKYTLEDVIIPEPPGSVELKTTLIPSGLISGHVYHADGSPAAGVSVLKENIGSIFRRHKAKESDKGWFLRFSKEGVRIRDVVREFTWGSVTNNNGFFCFKNVERGVYGIYLSVQGREILKKSPIPITEDNNKVELELTLPHLSGSIEGIIKDGNGNSIDGACVVAWDGDELFNMTRSDKNGRYGFYCMPDGRYVIDARVLSTAIGTQTGSSGSGGKGEMESLESLNAYNAIISNGQPCRLDLAIIDPWNSIVLGQVITKSRPLPRFIRISLDELNDKMEKKRLNILSQTLADLFQYDLDKKDQDKRSGYFRFEALRAGLYQIKVAWGNEWNDLTHEKRLFKTKPFLLKGSTSYPLTVHLAFATISGTVVDKTTGEEISNAQVILHYISNKDYRKDIELLSGKDGFFKGEDIPAGTYIITVRPPVVGSFLEGVSMEFETLKREDFQIFDNVDQHDLRFELIPAVPVENGGN